MPSVGILLTAVSGAHCEAKAKEHLKMWRTIKRDPKLAAAPTYWQLASSRHLKVPVFVSSSPRIRNMLDAHARCANVMSDNFVLDGSQTIDRVAARSGGEMLTLTRACGSIFAPGAGVTLSVAQCFAMQGSVGPHTRCSP